MFNPFGNKGYCDPARRSQNPNGGTYGNPTAQVDEKLNETYHVVKAVYDGLPAIDYVFSHVSQIEALPGQLADAADLLSDTQSARDAAQLAATNAGYILTATQAARDVAQGIADSLVIYDPTVLAPKESPALTGAPTINGHAIETQDHKGAAGGYAPLGSDGKVPGSYLPADGSYQGNWNASTNTPTITAGVGTSGDFFTVSVAGTQSITGVPVAFGVGDQVRYTTNGNKWERIPSSNVVASVAGRTGAVTLVKADVGLGNVDNTSDANKPVSTAQAAAIGAKVNKSGDTFTGPVTIDGGSGNALFRLQSTTSHYAYQDYARAGTIRWQFGMDNSTEPGGNVGSDMFISRFSDTGVYLGTALGINRATGDATFYGGRVISTNGTGNARLEPGGDIIADRGNNTGIVYLGASGSRYLYYNNTNYDLAGAQLYINGSLAWNSGNDGAGSGLDADLLDGQDGSYYAPINNPAFTGTALTVNAGKLLVQHDGSNAYIRPTNAGSSLFLGAGNTNTVQLTPAGAVLIGGNVAWHAGNDGAGSGLDADLLDGRQASDFSLLDGSTTYTGPVNSTNVGNQAHFKAGGGNNSTVIHRNDGSNYYILLSDPSTGGVNPSWNGLRPFTINLTTGYFTSANGQAFSGGMTVTGGMTVDGASVTVRATNRAALAALSLVHPIAWLMESGREGWFKLKAGATPTDPQQGIYVASSTSGYYWQREWDGHHAKVEWFGAVPNDASGGAQAANVTAIHAALAICPVVILGPADYFTNATLKHNYANTMLLGAGGKYDSVNGLHGTRVLITDGTSDIIQFGPDANPGGIGLFRQNVRAKGIFFQRTVAPAVTTSSASVRVQYLLEAHFEDVTGYDSMYSWVFYGTVHCIAHNCTAARVSAGTGGTDSWKGFYVNGSSGIAAGGNASLYLTYCHADDNRTVKTNSVGFLADGKFTDTYWLHCETVNCTVGMEVAGNAATTNDSGNSDMVIFQPINDASKVYGLYVHDLGITAVVEIISPYSGPSAGASAGMEIIRCFGVGVTGGEMLMASASSANGIRLEDSESCEINGTLISEATSNPMVTSNIASCRVAPNIKNKSVTSGEAIYIFGTTKACKFDAVVNGKAGAFTYGYRVNGTGDDRNEYNMTGINSDCIVGGSGNKLVRNGVPVTTPYTLSGTNMPTGVAA